MTSSNDIRRHVAPAAVMIGCLLIVLWAAVFRSIWTAGGFGAAMIIVWAWARLNTGIWPHSFDDIEIGLKPGSRGREED